VSDVFKIGDVIIFQAAIVSKEYCLELIPARHPCKILHITKDHVVVLYKNTKYKLRNIPNRMIVLDGLAKALYE
jgi:hypothetical protein